MGILLNARQTPPAAHGAELKHSDKLPRAALPLNGHRLHITAYAIGTPRISNLRRSIAARSSHRRLPALKRLPGRLHDTAATDRKRAACPASAPRSAKDGLPESFGKEAGTGQPWILLLPIRCLASRVRLMQRRSGRYARGGSKANASQKGWKSRVTLFRANQQPHKSTVQASTAGKVFAQAAQPAELA